MKFANFGRLAVLAAIATMGTLLGATLGLARSSDQHDVRHIIVQLQANDGSAARAIEYWFDEGRGLAKSSELGSEGRITNVTGPNWHLHIPVRGAALYSEGMEGPARSVVASLFYMRDAYVTGAARLIASRSDLLVVQLGARTSALIPASGLPLWERIGGFRVDYTYEPEEWIRSSDLPPDFFSSTTDREVAHTISTTPEAAAAKVQFTLLSGGDELLGRTLEQTLVSYGGNDWTLQQVGQVYGSDIQISMSLLGREPVEVRPGGRPVATAIGDGSVYSDAGRVHLLILRGRIATSIFAPDEATAVAVAASIRPIR